MRHRYRIFLIGLILSIVAGLVSVLPNLYFLNSLESKGIPIIATDAESWYLSRVNGVYKGCIYNCNPYIKEYNYKYPHFDSSLSESILALPGVVFHINILTLKVIYEFLLLALLYLLVYLLVYRLTKNLLISILGASTIVLGYNLINVTDLINLPDIVDLFRFKTDYTQFLIFSRPVNPQFSSLYFILYLHVLLSAIQNKNKKWFAILAITYGFSFYIYFFTYAFATVAQGLWVGLYLVRKEYKTLLYFSLSILFGLFLAIPVFIQVFKLLCHPFYTTVPVEYLIKTHVPDVGLIAVILLIIFILVSFVYKNKYKTINDSSYFVFILVLSCFVTRNEHVISGMIMQYNHFEVYLFTPVLVIALCFILYSFLDKEIIHKYRLVVIATILLVFFNASLIQYNSYKHWLAYATFTQNYVQVLDFIRDKLPVESVISAPQTLSQFIPLYTPDYVLWAFYAGQWISVPGRIDDVIYARTSDKALLEIGKKYTVDYFVEDKKDNLLKNSNLENLYEDKMFVVYKAKY